MGGWTGCMRWGGTRCNGMGWDRVRRVFYGLSWDGRSDTGCDHMGSHRITKQTGQSSVLFFSFGLASGGIPYSRHFTVFFGRDSAPTGHRGRGSVTCGTPRGTLRRMQYPHDTPGRDPPITGLHEMYCTGSNDHEPLQYCCVPRQSA